MAAVNTVAESPLPGLWRQVLARANGGRFASRLALALIVASIAAGLATYGALTESFGATRPATVTLLLTLDLILLLLLGALIARRVVGIWAERRRGLAGSRLHVRLVAVFSLLAVAPAIIVAAFSAIFFYVGIEAWFSDRVRTAVNESLAVAQAYLHEHQQNIRADALAMANDLNQEAPRLIFDQARFNRVVATQAALRSLSEAMVFDGTTGQILARADFSFSLGMEPLPASILEQARSGEVALMVNESDDRVRALVRLDRFVDAYLYVGRFVESRVLAHMATAQEAVKQYAELEGSRSSLKITVTLIFIVVALLLLLAAVWSGLNFATDLVTPISALIGAAERVRAGDLSTRVAEAVPEDEIGTLSRAFNRMTSQIEGQRTDLIEANHQLDLRRRFTEAVLAGVSAGVIGLDHAGVINLPNQPAAHLFGVADLDSMVGRSLTEVVPELGELMESILRRPGRMVEAQVQVKRKGTPLRTLLVRIVAEMTGVEVRGFVVTCDDVTELLSAQRKAAWADVARRIAHEIKNPLTPIQLSAERLRRKYLKEITSDPDTFKICTDTIVRQVVDIGRMVDEFSAFARMPTPVMSPQNLNDLCRQAVFLQASAHAAIQFECLLPSERLTVPCDGRQISQALTNLLQNAVDAIDGREAPEGASLPAGRIAIRVAPNEDGVTITVEDNGKGLPSGEERHRLTEPYVTTRAKGTGLGLAIVRKIMEDHGGLLTLDDHPGGGALVSLFIPRTQDLGPSPATAPADGSQRKQMAYGA
ncbi:MAG: HAMP domain-containing protein [Azospirillum sp.]|nr:HAMP domain-containing protein [Azospirillum sp.]